VKVEVLDGDGTVVIEEDSMFVVKITPPGLVGAIALGVVSGYQNQFKLSQPFLL
jgi:hypothetical protein